MKTIQEVITLLWTKIAAEMADGVHLPAHAIMGRVGEDEDESVYMVNQSADMEKDDFAKLLKEAVRQTSPNFVVMVNEAWMSEGVRDATTNAVKTEFTGKWPHIEETMVTTTPVDTLCIAWAEEGSPTSHVLTKTIVTAENGRRTLDDASFRECTGLTNRFLDGLFVPAMVH